MKIEIGTDDEIPLTSGRLASPGPAFITRAEKGISWGGKEVELEKLANPEDIGRLLLFDTWVLNSDRHPPDLTARRPNRDNVFLSRVGARRGRLVIKAIDHTHCLTSGREIGGHLADIENVRDQRIYGLFPEFEKHLVRREVMRAVSDLCAIDRSGIQTIVENIPRAWQVSAPSRNALVNFLCDRGNFLCENFITLLWRQSELDI